MEYNILHIEDSQTDADIIQRVLHRSGLQFRYHLASDKEEVENELATFKPDIVLCDHSLPSFNSKMAYTLCKQENLDLSFILVTGTVSEEFAVEMLRMGVDDYLLKSNLQRLPAAIKNILSKKESEKKIQSYRSELYKSETHLRTIIENSSVGLLLVDRNCIILEMNDRARYYNLISFGRELVKNENLLENIPANRRDGFLRKLETSLQGERIQYESVYPQPDGSVITFDVKLSPTINGEGTVTGTCITLEDISERKRAEQAIRESEIFNRSILTSIPYHIAVIEDNGNIISVNKAWNDFSTQNVESVLGRTAIGSNYITVCKAAAEAGDSKAADALHGFQQVLNKDIPFFEMEYACDVADEQPCFLVRIVPFADGLPKVVMMHIDITERKKSEMALVESENEIRALAESMPQMVWTANGKGENLYFNKQWVDYTGLSLEESYGTGWIKSFHPEDQLLAAAAWDIAINSLSEYSIECRLQRYDGHYHWWLIKGVPKINDKQEIVKWYGTCTNIEKIKRVIERYDILADATSDTIWDWDIVNNIMIYNDGITKMFGYHTSEVKNVVEWWNDKIHAENFGTVTEALENIFEKKTERLQLQYRFRCANGSYKYIFDRAFVLFDENGKPTRMIGAMQDITYQTEEEIRMAKAIIDAQEQERNFLGAELHDNINQILVGTLLTLSLAKSKKADATHQSGLINSAITYITDAINETRKLAHILAPVSFENNSLKVLFKNLLLAINLENLFTIELDFDELTETVIQENIQVNLYRILQEQTKNILKYAEASTIEIALKINDNAVSLRIYDDGNGFDVKARKSGIGLSSIKKRAESLSGKFNLTSAPGKGCEIMVEIPLCI